MAFKKVHYCSKNNMKGNKMRFIHIADLHLDAKFDNLEQIDNIPQKRRLEQRNAMREIIKYVKENNIDMIFIAGDLYEQKYIRKSSIDYINKLFLEIPNVKIFIAPGNHDPYIQNSFYATYNWAENVHIFKNKIEKIDIGNIHIYGYGFTDFYCKESELEEIKIEEKKDINILLTHGSLDSSSEEEREYNPLKSHKLKKLGFDYIALGHIHKPYYNEEKNQTIYYPGSIISLGFDELGEHGMLAGQIDEESLEVEFVPIDQREFEEKEIDISNFSSNEDIVSILQELKLKEENFYKIILTGKRFFKLDINEIKKLVDIKNIIKIKDKTKTGIDIYQIQKENNIRGIFVKNMLEKQKKEGLDQDFIEKAIEIGLEVL